MSQYLHGLNDKQYEATVYQNGPLLILAGAGSGKTRVLTHRIAYLIEQGVRPWNILAVTFTNKAANEMRDRVLEMVGDDAHRVWLSTFHSICVRILRADIELVGLSNNFNIYDSDDQKRLMKTVLKELNINSIDRNNQGVQQVRAETLARIYLHDIERAKRHARRYDEITAYLNNEGNKNAAVVFAEYHKRLNRANALDFNDIINFTVHLLEDNPSVLKKRQQQFQHIMVDEYQDTNPAQYQLIKMLALSHQNIMVVGDDDQSIYGFRGADIENINNFVDDFQAHIVRLEQNYRSYSNILTVSNSVIANNKGRMAKEMWTKAPEGELIETIVGFNEYNEAEQIRNRIVDFRNQGVPFSSIAIIYRTNSSALIFEKVFREEGMPCVAIGAQKFYDRKEIKDTISYLKLLLNPRDEIAFERALTNPKRGIGKKSLQDIFQLALKQDLSYIKALHRWASTGKGKAKQNAKLFAQGISNVRSQAMAGLEPHLVLDAVLSFSGYKTAMEETIAVHQNLYDELLSQKKPRHLREQHQSAIEENRARLDNIASLREELRRQYETSDDADSFEDLPWLQRYLDSAMLHSSADKEDGRDLDSITMLTAHSAKGLEFPIVFVTGLSQGQFPHERALQDVSGKGIEEERRLVYVAFTRAKQQLIISRPKKTLHMNAWDPDLSESVFWNEIPVSMFQQKQRGSPLLRNHHKKNKPTATMEVHTSKSKWNPNQFTPKLKNNLQQPEGPFQTREVTSLDELQPNVWIIHPSLGIGIIQTRLVSSQGLKIKVHFNKRGSIMIPLYTNCFLEIVEI